jgi:hypothetical protein
MQFEECPVVAFEDDNVFISIPLVADCQILVRHATFTTGDQLSLNHPRRVFPGQR